MPCARQARGRPAAQVDPVAERDEQDVAPVAVPADRAERRPGPSAVVRRGPAAVALLEQVAGVVPRDRLDEHADPALARASSKQARSSPGASAGGWVRRAPARGCRAARRASCRCGSGRRTLAGRPGRRPGPPSRCGTARRRRRQRRRLAAQLVLGVVQVGEVLDLGHRHEPGQGGAQGGAEDRLLVEQGVEDPPAAEPLVQAAGDAVHAALDRHVLAEDECLGMGRQQLGERGVDRPAPGSAAGPSPGAAARPAPSAGAGESRAAPSPRRGCRAAPRRHAGGLVHHPVTDRLVARRAPRPAQRAARRPARGRRRGAGRARSRPRSRAGSGRRSRCPSRRGRGTGRCSGAGRPANVGLADVGQRLVVTASRSSGRRRPPPVRDAREAAEHRARPAAAATRC